jgi:hypothetical protein
MRLDITFDGDEVFGVWIGDGLALMDAPVVKARKEEHY